MAKISAHGEIVGTVEFTTVARRYMSDGKILQNNGSGWKIAGKVKPHATPQQAFEAMRAKQQEELARRPALAEYRRQLHALCGVGKRARLHGVIELMPDDADGVWSTACDGYGDNVHADIGEIVQLCDAYNVVIAERAASQPQPVA